MTTRTKPALKVGFRKFVDLVKAIPEVRHVVAIDDEGGDFYTCIDHRNDDACRLIFAAEKIIRWQFVEEEFDFHIVYLEGRTVDQIFTPLPALVFSRDA